MKAAVTTGNKKQIIIMDIPKPPVQPGTLLLKMRLCSICGSDLEYLDGSFEQYKHWDAFKLHAGAVLGHEFCAEVAEVGEGVEGWSVGERAAPIGKWQVPCLKCYWCRRGLYSLCMGEGVSPRTPAYQNIPGGYGSKTGSMAEYFVRPPNRIQKVPDSVSDEEAAMVEPLGIAVGSVETAGLKDGSPVVILGAGRIGLGAMLCAKAAGASPVIITDILQSRLDLALEMGADVVLNPAKVDVIDEVVKLTEAGPDAVIIVVREGKVMNEAVDMVREGGTVVLTGFVPPTEVNPAVWVDKRLKILTNRGGSMVTAMRLMAQKQINIKPLISEIMPLEEAQRGFDSMYSGKNIAVLLRP